MTLTMPQMLASALILAGAVATPAAKKTPIATVVAASDTETVRTGGEARLTLKVTVAEGWHVNAHKPALDYLVGTSVELETEGVTIVEAGYPEPVERKFKFSAEPFAVLEGEFEIAVKLRFGDALEPGLLALKGHVTYQACDDETCRRPTRAEFNVPLRVTAGG